MDNILVKMRRAIDVRRSPEPLVRDVRSSIITMNTYKYVLLAVAVAAFYYLFIASDIYVTRAQLYVKSTGASAGVVPQLALLGANTVDDKDTTMVVAYAGSQEMLSKLEDKIGFSEHFSASDWDFWARLSSSPSEESRLKYFRKRLHTNVHPESGIITLRAQAFTPELSLKMVEEAIRNAEAFINGVGHAIALEEIAFVEQEMERSRQNLAAVRAKVLRFQNDNGIMGVEANGAARQAMVNEMENQLVRMQTNEKTLAAYLNPAAADLVAVRDGITALKSQLVIEREKLASQNGVSTNDINATFQALELELQFATDLYQNTLVGLEKARIESYKKLKHLVVIQAPQLPDEALEPRKIYNIISLFVALTLAYGIITMIVATVREHRDV